MSVHTSIGSSEQGALRGQLISSLADQSVGILYGGWDEEADVSKASAARLVEAFLNLGIDANLIEAEKLTTVLEQAPPNLLINVLYGSLGEGGAVASLLQSLGVGSIYSGPEASPKALDKWRAKLLLKSAGLPVVDSIVVDNNEPFPDNILSRLSWPLICKPLEQGSSVGIALCKNYPELANAIESQRGFAGSIIEEFLPGREFTVAVLDMGDGPKAFPVIEIICSRPVADQTAKYTHGVLDLACPANISAEFAALLADLAIRAYRALDCSPVARIDFRLDAGGAPFIMEVNHHPGMTPHSWLPVAAAAAGYDYELLLLQLLAAAVRREGTRAGSNIAVSGQETLCPETILLVSSKAPRSPSHTAAEALGHRIPNSSILTAGEAYGALLNKDAKPIVVDLLYDSLQDNVQTRGLLDALGVRRIGPSLLCCSIAADKLIQRNIIESLAIPQPSYCSAALLLGPGDSDLPFVLKRRRSGQSLGVRYCEDSSELASMISDIPSDEISEWIVEEFISGVEIHVGLLTKEDGSVEVLPIAEFDFAHEGPILTYQMKSDLDRIMSLSPNAGRRALDEIVRNSLEVHKAFDRPPMARVEWRLAANGSGQLIEYDHSPGILPGSILTKMIELTAGSWPSVLPTLKKGTRYRGLLHDIA